MPISIKSVKFYSGFFSAVLGGSLIGFGVAVMAIIRGIVEVFESTGDPRAFSDLHIFALVMIIIGLVVALSGLYEIRSSQT